MKNNFSFIQETDDEKQIHLHEQYDMIDPSQLSPLHSADESPDVCKYFIFVYHKNFLLQSASRYC